MPEPTWRAELVSVADFSVWLKLSWLRVVEDLNPVVLAFAMLSPMVSMLFVKALRAETPLVSEPMSAIVFCGFGSYLLGRRNEREGGEMEGGRYEPAGAALVILVTSEAA